MEIFMDIMNSIFALLAGLMKAVNQETHTRAFIETGLSKNHSIRPNPNIC